MSDNILYYIKYTFIIISGFLGLWIILTNWRIFWVNIRKNRHSSWIPILGGLFLGISFFLIPNNSFRWLFWIAFIIDWGSLPGTVYTIIWYVIHNKKS